MASAAVIPLDTVREFPTPEHIAFRFRLAGPTARSAAWLIDPIIRVVVLAILGLAFGIIGLKVGIGASPSAASSSTRDWRAEVLGRLAHAGVLAVDTEPERLTPALVSEYLRVKARHLL